MLDSPAPRVVMLGATALAIQVGFLSSATAQSPTAESTGIATLEPSLTEGDQLRDSGDLPAALRAYRAAQAKQDSLRCQRSIAELEDRLGQYAFAYIEYARLLDHYGSSLDPVTRGAIEARMRGLDEQTGMVSLAPLFAGAAIRVDGRPIPNDLYVRPLRLARGDRQITVEQPGYSPVTLTVSVGASPTQVTLPLQALPTLATLNVSALSNAEATLFVDGQRYGALPQRLQLSPGEHVLYADGPSVYAPAQKVVVGPQQIANLTLQLLMKTAIVDVEPMVPDAVLYVDDRPVGTGTRSIELPPGRHVLELRRPGFRVQRLVYDAVAGQRKPVRAGQYVQLAASAPLPTDVTSPPPASADKSPGTETTNPKQRSEPEKESPYVGIFGDVIVPIMLAGDSTHSYNSQCPADAWNGACTTSAPKGGGLGLRLGFFYEWIGLELMGAGALDVSTAELKFPPVSTISQEMLDLAGRSVFLRTGGILGGGLRITTPIQGIRLTVGADYVYVMRKVITIPDSYTSGALSYSVPGWFIDGGIQLGSTPGARFYLGAFLLMETAHDLTLNRNLEALGVDTSLVPAELTTMKIYQGRQYFYGPLLGIAFGH